MHSYLPILQSPARVPVMIISIRPIFRRINIINNKGQAKTMTSQRKTAVAKAKRLTQDRD